MSGKADARPPAIALMGPTASGKTDMALALARHWPVHVISVDSALVYRGLDIGSAKPEPQVLAQTPHALIDVREPWQSYSAADFRHDALQEMDQAAALGRIPLLVGGTGLYFRALFVGLSELPPADPEVRERILIQARQHGWDSLHAELARHDPAAAARIHRNDPQRIQRALEVLHISGRSLSELHQDSRQRLPWRCLRLVLAPKDRHWLHQRIVRRLQMMIEQGFLDEVRRLMQQPQLHADLPAMRAVGYRQAWAHLSGDIGRDEFEQAAMVATRQLAKRQLTWLRRELDSLWIDIEAAGARDRVFERVTRHLAT